MSGTLKIGGKTLATHDTSSNKLAFHSDANDTGQLCRAWVNFSDENTTIRASFNVSSVTDNTNYNTVNFINPMPDTNYCIVGAGGDSGSDSGCWFTTGYNVNSVNTNNTTTSFRIQMYYQTGSTGLNNAYIYAAVFR
jgi:hypothetical protein